MMVSIITSNRGWLDRRVVGRVWRTVRYVPGQRGCSPARRSNGVP